MHGTINSLPAEVAGTSQEVAWRVFEELGGTEG